MDFTFFMLKTATTKINNFEGALGRMPQQNILAKLVRGL